MRYFLDTEFAYRVSDPSHLMGPDSEWSLDLISIGVVAEDEREFYAINIPGVAGANHFVRDCVLPYLGDGKWSWEWEIQQDLAKFITDKPEFWVYMGAFDYVLLSRLMGGFDGWPKGWPYLAYDLRQLLDHTGRAEVNQPNDAPHSAIEDARWVASTYREVMG